MRKSNRDAIRELLRNAEDGLCTSDIAKSVGIDSSSARAALLTMPDAYIDRWDNKARGPLAAVWCVVIPPEHCPKPDPRPGPKPQDLQ